MIINNGIIEVISSTLKEYKSKDLYKDSDINNINYIEEFLDKLKETRVKNERIIDQEFGDEVGIAL